MASGGFAGGFASGFSSSMGAASSAIARRNQAEQHRQEMELKRQQFEQQKRNDAFQQMYNNKLLEHKKTQMELAAKQGDLNSFKMLNEVLAGTGSKATKGMFLTQWYIRMNPGSDPKKDQGFQEMKKYLLDIDPQEAETLKNAIKTIAPHLKQTPGAATALANEMLRNPANVPKMWDMIRQQAEDARKAQATRDILGGRPSATVGASPQSITPAPIPGATAVPGAAPGMLSPSPTGSGAVPSAGAPPSGGATLPGEAMPQGGVAEADGPSAPGVDVQPSVVAETPGPAVVPGAQGPDLNRATMFDPSSGAGASVPIQPNMGGAAGPVVNTAPAPRPFEQTERKVDAALAADLPGVASVMQGRAKTQMELDPSLLAEREAAKLKAGQEVKAASPAPAEITNAIGLPGLTYGQLRMLGVNTELASRPDVQKEVQTALQENRSLLRDVNGLAKDLAGQPQLVGTVGRGVRGLSEFLQQAAGGTIAVGALAGMDLRTFLADPTYKRMLVSTMGEESASINSRLTRLAFNLAKTLQSGRLSNEQINSFKEQITSGDPNQILVTLDNLARLSTDDARDIVQSRLGFMPLQMRTKDELKDLAKTYGKNQSMIGAITKEVERREAMLYQNFRASGTADAAGGLNARGSLDADLAPPSTAVPPPAIIEEGSP